MLELKHLCFEAETDEGVRQILKDVNLTVDERMVVITGPNGSGKSTMAKLIAGHRAADLRSDPARRRGHHAYVHHRACTPRHQLRFQQRSL